MGFPLDLIAYSKCYRNSGLQYTKYSLVSYTQLYNKCILVVVVVVGFSSVVAHLHLKD